MASMAESVEYNTLIGSIAKLTTAFKSSPISFANQLLSNGFISPEVYDKVTGMTSVLGDDMKAASNLVKCVTDQVSMCPGRYYDFMALPLFKETWMSSLYNTITTDYEMLKKAVSDQERKKVPLGTPIVDDIDEHFFSKNTDENVEPGDACEVFRCPCGECSLESYLEVGCPKSNSASFPYLDVSKLDEDNKEDLTHQLAEDTSDMIMRFAELLDEIRVSLKRQGVSVQSLAARALSLGAYESNTIQKPLLSEDEKKLGSSNTIDEAFLVLRPHMSFFNFELLKHITNSTELCSNSDREHMDEYIGKFDAFCKRKVFEVPPGAVGQPAGELKKLKRKLFAVLMTKHEAEPNLIFVEAAKRKIAKLFKLKPSTLHLHRIDEGSLIFVFSVPNFVARQLFPLKPSVMVKLKEEGLLVSLPSAIEDHQKDTSTKRRRKSWPTGSTERTINIVRSFSLDFLHMKDKPGTAFLLLCAALKGRTELVQKLIQTEKKDILKSQWNGKSALMLAAEGGHTETVKALLNAGADTEETVLILAARGGHTETVKALIKAGADIALRNKDEETALMLAARGGHTEMVNALIKAGADMNLGNKTEKAAFMLATHGGHTETVEALIEAGADIALRNQDEETALMLAAQGGHTGTVKALIEADADMNLNNS